MGSETFSCNSLMQSIEKMIVFLIHFLPSFEKIKLPLRYFGYFFNCFSFWEVGCAKIFVKSFCLFMTQRYSSNFFQLLTEGVSHHTHHLDPNFFFLFCPFMNIFFQSSFLQKSNRLLYVDVNENHVRKGSKNPDYTF